LLRFSQWALAAVVAVVATGVFAAWRQVGVSWGALSTTPYGKLVIYKSLGLAALVLLASVSRSSVHGSLAVPGTRRRGPSTVPAVFAEPSAPHPVGADVALPVRNWRRDATTRLRVAVGAEIVVLFAVLGLTAALVNARPAKQAYAAPFSTEVKAGPTLVNVVVDPAKAGPLAIHLYILTSDGVIENVPEVDATMSDTAAGINGLKIPLQQAGPGHFLVYRFDVPIAGTWTINVTVRTDALDEYFSDPIIVHVR
jgi:copper transport protein